MAGELWHLEAQNKFYGAENDAFFERSLDFVASALNAPEDSRILDAGCGVGMQAIRLARRGFVVHGVDALPAALEEAEKNITLAGLRDRITISEGDVRAFSFEDGAFEYVLCQGVLMHVHQVDEAIAELVRVLKPGGSIVIGENNASSLQARVSRLLSRIRPGARPGRRQMTPRGWEVVQEGSEGSILVRTASIPWLIDCFERSGCRLRTRACRQFTEWYLKVPDTWLARLIHAFNGFWMTRVRWPGPCYGNVLIFQKRASSND
jgi:SAM-dependent methyltransferase